VAFGATAETEEHMPVSPFDSKESKRQFVQVVKSKKGKTTLADMGV